MRALSILAYAATIKISPDILKPALWCSRGTVSLLEDFDHVLKYAPASPLSLYKLELLAQLDWISRIEGHEDLRGDAGLTAARGDEVFRKLPDVATEVACENGWQMQSS